jgi:hypothetical protein
MASVDLYLEREVIESSSDVSSPFREPLLLLLPVDESKILWPFKSDSHICGLVEEEEETDMGKELAEVNLQARPIAADHAVISLLAYASSTLR